MTCADAGRLGADKRRQIEREPIRRECQRLREAFGMPPHPGLIPPLILTQGDRA